MRRECRPVENVGDLMMKTDLFEIARGFIPLKELGVVVILIWVGSFLSMIPQMIDDVEKTKISQRNEEINAQNTSWANEELRKRGVAAE